MEFVPVSLDLDFKSVKSAIKNAEKRFIIPIIGSAFYKELIEKIANEQLQEPFVELIETINSATAPLAMWEHAKIGGVSIDSSGIYKPKNDGRWNLGDSEQNKLEGSFLHTGLCALDDMVNFLNDNHTSFTTYSESNERKRTFDTLVPTAKVVEEVFAMLYPNVTFRAMQESIRFVEKRIASNMQEYHAALIDKPEADLTNFDKKFREAARTAIIYLATSRALLTRTVKLTAQGLEVMMGERSQVSQPENARIESAAREYASSGELELQNLLSLLNANPPAGYLPPVVTVLTDRWQNPEDSRIVLF